MISLFSGMRRQALLLVFVFGCQGVWAGPAEDYAAGGKIYESGDVVGAMPILRRSADSGYAPAQALLAYIFDYSEYDEDAVVYYRKAADQGNANGQFGLGTMLSLGKGVKKNLAEARRWITLAAEQGHKQAINVMAQAYLGGQLDISENERQGEDALKWVKLAADNGYLLAIDSLVLAYRNGSMGLAADAAAASYWQAKANELRNIKPVKGKGKNKEIKK